MWVSCTDFTSCMYVEITSTVRYRVIRCESKVRYFYWEFDTKSHNAWRFHKLIVRFFSRRELGPTMVITTKWDSKKICSLWQKESNWSVMKPKVEKSSKDYKKDDEFKFNVKQWSGTDLGMIFSRSPSDGLLSSGTITNGKISRNMVSFRPQNYLNFSGCGHLRK